MPKTTITFNLPEERRELDYALKGLDFGLVIWKTYMLLAERDMDKDQQAVLSAKEALDLLAQAMNEFNVTFEDLPD